MVTRASLALTLGGGAHHDDAGARPTCAWCGEPIRKTRPRGPTRRYWRRRGVRLAHCGAACRKRASRAGQVRESAIARRAAAAK